MGAPPSNTVLLPSAARTATTEAPAALTNQGWSAALFFLSTTVAPAGESLQLVLEAQDPASKAWVTYATFGATALAFVGTKVCLLSSGAVETVAAADVEVQALPLPGHFRWRVVHSAAASWTYSLGVSYLP